MKNPFRYFKTSPEIIRLVHAFADRTDLIRAHRAHRSQAKFV